MLVLGVVVLPNGCVFEVFIDIDGVVHKHNFIFCIYVSVWDESGVQVNTSKVFTIVFVGQVFIELLPAQEDWAVVVEEQVKQGHIFCIPVVQQRNWFLSQREHQEYIVSQKDGRGLVGSCFLQLFDYIAGLDIYVLESSFPLEGQSHPGVGFELIQFYFFYIVQGARVSQLSLHSGVVETVCGHLDEIDILSDGVFGELLQNGRVFVLREVDHPGPFPQNVADQLVNLLNFLVPCILLQVS